MANRAEAPFLSQLERLRQLVFVRGRYFHLRAVVEAYIATVPAKKRQEFIDKNANRSGQQDDLGSAISQSILQLAAKKGYTAEQ